MKSFLREVQEESQQFRNEALRIEELNKSLTLEYRSLASSASNKIFISQKPKPPSRARDTGSMTSRRTSSRKKMPIKEGAYTARTKRKPVLITQNADNLKEEHPSNTTNIVDKKNRCQINIDSIPPIVKKKRPSSIVSSN